MAYVMDEAKYEAMISALHTFASNIDLASSEMTTLASVCVAALSEEDRAVGEIYKNIKDCQLKYSKAAGQAKIIAQLMQQELDESRKENAVWNNSDDF